MSKELKLTPWFRGVNPARDGVYEVFWCLNPVYARFTKHGWMHGEDKNKEAAARVNEFAAGPPSRWRGLAVKP